VSRYLRVFDENGQPSDKWQRVDRLIANLLQNKQLLSDGTGGFGSFVHHKKWEQLISGVLCVQLPDQDLLNADDTTRICMGALDRCAKRGESDPLTARKAFVQMCESEIGKLLAQGERVFTIHSSLSLPSSASGEFVYQGAAVRCGATAVPTPVLPPIMNDARNADLAEAWRRCRYLPTCVNISALTPSDAVRRGVRLLDLMRALLSLRYGIGSESIQLVGRREAPLAKVHLGPLHLVAEGVSAACIDDAWDDELYSRDWKQFPLDKDWEGTAAELRQLLNRVSALPYRLQMENLLCRYVAALDETRWSVTLLQLWSIVEKLTDTIGHNQKHLASRAARVFSDGDLARDVIEAVRCTRNRLVHAGHARPLNERWASELKRTVETHLHHLLWNTFGVTSTEEYATLLGMPQTNTVLRREIALRQAMIEFQDEKQ
jgi:hypothetical protein